MLSWFIAAALILIFELFVGTIYLLVVSAALFGAGLTVASDLAARSILAGTELPVGVVTGALGCVFFLALLLRKRN